MTPQQLKASILQMAIEGRLVPQLDDEPAVEIDTIEPKEVPFAIPEKWKWVKLSSVGEKLQYGYTASAQASGKVKLLRITDITKKGVHWDSVPFCHIGNCDINKFKLRLNDILIARTGGTIGKSYRINDINCLSVFASYLIRVRVFSDIILPEYAQIYLCSPWYWEQLRDKSRGTGQPNVNAKSLGDLLIPLPPLDEQRRIVARLEEFLPLIEEYGKSYTALQNIEKSLPDQLRSSLLQEAIQGKLVPQLDDEPAVEIDAAEPEDVPFAIPEKWKWVRLGDISHIVRGGSPRPIKNYLTDSNDGINWIKISDSTRGSKYITKCEEKIIPSGLKKSRFVNSGTLILSNSMSFGYPYILKIDGCIHDGWLAIAKFESQLYVEYLYFLLCSPYCRSKFAASAAGAVVKNLNIGKVESLVIPLPPLTEQRRIVARLEELLPQVEAIEGLR